MSNGLTEYEIVKMAREAGGVQLFTPRELGAFHKKAPDIHISMTPDALERFAALCRAPLVAEVEQTKKDAERYRWLRKSHHDDDSAIGVTRERMNGWGRVVGKSLRNSDLDKAIDEAIAKEQS